MGWDHQSCTGALWMTKSLSPAFWTIFLGLFTLPVHLPTSTPCNTLLIRKKKFISSDCDVLCFEAWQTSIVWLIFNSKPHTGWGKRCWRLQLELIVLVWSDFSLFWINKNKAHSETQAKCFPPLLKLLNMPPNAPSESKAWVCEMGLNRHDPVDEEDTNPHIH